MVGYWQVFVDCRHYTTSTAAANTTGTTTTTTTYNNNNNTYKSCGMTTKFRALTSSVFVPPPPPQVFGCNACLFHPAIHSSVLASLVKSFVYLPFWVLYGLTSIYFSF